MSEQGRVDLERLRGKATRGRGEGWPLVTHDDLAALLAVVDAARAYAERTEPGDELRCLLDALEPFTPAGEEKPGAVFLEAMGVPAKRPAGEYVHKVDVTEMTPPSSFASSFRAFNVRMQEQERAQRVAALGIELRRMDGGDVDVECNAFPDGPQVAPAERVDTAVSDAVSSDTGGRSESCARGVGGPQIPSGPAPIDRAQVLVEALSLILVRIEDANQEFARLDIGAVARAALAEWEQA